MTITQKRVLDKTPIKELRAYCKEREDSYRLKFGKGATKKVLRMCPDCRMSVGVRELRRHRRRVSSECPARQRRAA